MSSFTLKGRWHGDLHDPNRHFTGTVEEPGASRLDRGAPITITFQCDQYLLHHNPTHAHGRYSLEGMPDNTYVLTSFIRKDGVIKPEAQDDGEDQLWGGELYTTARAQPATPDNATSHNDH